ncbi:MAG: hypothetical protein ACPGUV_15050 [Polyangiales bacterium]
MVRSSHTSHHQADPVHASLGAVPRPRRTRAGWLGALFGMVAAALWLAAAPAALQAAGAASRVADNSRTVIEPGAIQSPEPSAAPRFPKRYCDYLSDFCAREKRHPICEDLLIGCPTHSNPVYHGSRRFAACHEHLRGPSDAASPRGV